MVTAMQNTLPQPSYAPGALAPPISQSTLEFRHDKHHRAHVETASTLANRVRLGAQPLKRIVKETVGHERRRAPVAAAAEASSVPGAPHCGSKSEPWHWSRALAWDFWNAPATIPQHNRQRVLAMLLAFVLATLLAHAGS